MKEKLSYIYVAQGMLSYFSNLFFREACEHPRIDGVDIPWVDDPENEALSTSFTCLEIAQGV